MSITPHSEESSTQDQMWYRDYNFVFRQFEKGHPFVDETVFYFRSDPKEEEHYIGYDTDMKKPYWAGLCDIPEGKEFSTAKELFEAEIYDGRSIKQRWAELILVSMGGLNVREIDDTWFA